jgi:hypothetical protein
MCYCQLNNVAIISWRAQVSFSWDVIIVPIFVIDSCLSCYPFSFGLCVICPSNYGLWLTFGIFKLSYRTWFDIMAIEPMVSCTLSDFSYLYPYKHDVQFISTPSWFVGDSFLSMLLVFVNIFRCQHNFHITWCSCGVRITQQMSHGLLTFMGHLSPSPVSCGLFCRSLLDLFDIVLYVILCHFSLWCHAKKVCDRQFQR